MKKKLIIGIPVIILLTVLFYFATRSNPTVQVGDTTSQLKSQPDKTSFSTVGRGESLEGITPPPENDKSMKYTHPQLGYTLSYPQSWKGGTQPPPYPQYSGYQDFMIYLESSNDSLAPYQQIPSIKVMAKKTDEKSATKEFEKDPLGKAVASNVNSLKIDEVEAISYNWSLEQSQYYTTTIFITDGIFYKIEFKWENGAQEEAFLPTYSELVDSFRTK